MITKHLDLWSSTVRTKSSAGRGGGKKRELYGIKKLRELILELAVRGLLVPQDPNDEPAEVLLEKIAEDKQRLIDEGKIKKQKKLDPIVEDEKAFKTPPTWKWAKLGIALNKITDGTHHSPPNSERGEVLYISAKNIKHSGVLLSNATYVTQAVHEEIFSRCDPEKGDLLYIKDGATTGIVTINNLEKPFSMLSSVALLKTPTAVLNTFLLLTLRSPFFYQSMRSGMTGVAITRVTLKKLNNALIPLPPLAEQHRIVAKVDELMALCDALEERQEDSLDTHETLAKTLLGTLTTAADPATFQQAWQRIQSHFHLLFTTESSIDHLKQTILQLAVMGKLVEQDPNDEPASELLKKIAEEKERLIKDKKIKKQKAIPPTPEREKSFGLPTEWKWARPNDFAVKITDGEHFKPPTADRGIYFLSAKDVRDEGVSLSAPLYISEETAEKALLRCNPEFGDILIVSRGATVGRICKVNIKDTFCLLGSVILIKPTALVLSEYLTIGFKSPWVLKQLVNASGSTAQPAIYLRDLKKIEFPLPPLAEQHRIVAKVDELMTLCDTLKVNLQSAQQTQLHLTDTLAQQATN